MMKPMSDKEKERMNEANQALQEWGGAHAKMWSYSASHSTLEVRLERVGVLGNLHLICIDCHRIEGATSMPTATFQVVESANSTLGRYLIQESGGNMKVLCNLVHVQKDVEPIYRRAQ